MAKIDTIKPQASSLKPQASSLKPQASSLKPQASSLKPQAASHVSARKKLITYLRKKIIPFIANKHQTSFIVKLPVKAKILDVGCGHKSAERAKLIRPDIYYVGVDVSEGSNKITAAMADEYILTTGEDFADTIKSLPDDFDAVISSHNLEHCNYPMKTIDAICGRLKQGGKLLLGFPSESSVTFPSRIGTLNFYDDITHREVPDFKAVMRRLIRDNRMSVDYVAAQYKPFIGRMIGSVYNLIFRKKSSYFLWYYYGFETMIWAHKK